MKRTALSLLLAAALFSFASLTRGSEWQWDVTETPPELNNPRMIDVSAMSPTHTAGWRRFFQRPNRPGKLFCEGWIYIVDLDDDEDAVVYMSEDDVLPYPMRITGGRNVRVIGLHFEIEVQPGCEAGALPNRPVDRFPNASIHPRMPGGIAVRIQQSGVTFLEGLYIDVNGTESDCIVSRNPDTMTDDVARSQRDVIVQNTWCGGVEGLGKSNIGDGVHGDLFQNQGNDILRRVVFENVSMRTSQEGIVLQGNGSLRGARSLVVRNYDYTWDPRFVGDDQYEQFGVALDATTDQDGWTLDTLYINDYREGRQARDYVIINGRRFGIFPHNSVQPHAEVHSGAPAAGAFAPPAHTGMHYVTPHDLAGTPGS